jgi:hypothetical protein
MIVIQYNSTGLINTQYRCDYTRAHAGHVMLYTYLSQSVSCLSTVERAADIQLVKKFPVTEPEVPSL